MTSDPLACHGTWHPALPNVHDLAAENHTLRAHVDTLVLALSRAHGVTENVIRCRIGLPAPNPWAARRQNHPDSVALRPLDGLTGRERPQAPEGHPEAHSAVYAIGVEACLI